LLSSATPPTRAPDLEQVFCLADRVPVPSTGLATLSGQEGRVRPLVEAHRRALAKLAREPALARAVAQEAFALDRREAAWAVDVARRYFTADGHVPESYIDAALRLVGGAFSPYALS
jgi:hypothetical protein